MKKSFFAPCLLIGCAGVFSLSPVFAAETQESMASLRQQIQFLMQQNKELTARVSQLEHDKTKESSPASDDVLEEKVTQILRHKEKEQLEGEGVGHMINSYVDFNGLIEVAGSSGKNFADESESRFELATVELGFVGKMTDWATAHLTFLYEEGGDDKVLVDDAHIFIGNLDTFPVYINVGRQYVPFGNFTSNMISDPLTLEIAETRETALQLGFAANGVYGSVFAFNGDTNEAGGDNRIEQYGANLGYTLEQDNFALDVGVSYMNSMGDSDGLSSLLKEQNLLESDYVDGFGAYAVSSLGPVKLIGEYITALDTFEDAAQSKPMAFNLEAAYAFSLGRIESTIALAYQGTDDMAGILPESRILGSLALGIFNSTTLAFEYAHDEDFDKADGGTNESADSFTGQLSYQF